MAADFRQFDEHGFPIPPPFDGIGHRDEDQSRRPDISLRTKRLVIVGLMLAIIVPVVFGPRLIGMGRETLARWLSSRAERKYQDGDPRGALVDLNRAIEWDPQAWVLYSLRAQWRAELKDLDGSFADWSRFIDWVQKVDVPRGRRNRLNRNNLLAEALNQRTWVLVRLGRHREAIDDASRAVQLNPTPQFLNGRAYARALTGLDLQEGLDDIERAIGDSGGELPEYLDTRGYLLHLLDRNEEALRDLNRAIELMEQSKRSLWRQQRLPFDRPRRDNVRRLDESLAVIYHHRGLVQKRLGRNADGSDDLRRADELGYDPASGVM